MTLAYSQVGGNLVKKPRVMKAEKPRGGATQGKEPLEGITFRGESPKVRKGRKTRRWVRESGGARRRRRRVQRSCGDGECASFWQTS
eukprot:5594077-Pleurochrysis_carterae.AAC.1